MGRPRRQEPEELRAMIVSTARNMLRDEDAGALTARALAKVLSIPASAIYRIFPTMSDVIMAVNQQTFAELDAIFDSLPSDVEASNRITNLTTRYMSFMQENPNLWRALFAGPSRKRQYPSWYLEAIQSLLARLAAILSEIAPDISDKVAMETAGKLYVLAHGALSLELDGRLQIITELSGRDIALEAIRTTIRDLKQSGA
ncbi:TetR/AcrR family transcriptional regulator [Brucellaceae bacterium C25G]